MKSSFVFIFLLFSTLIASEGVQINSAYRSFLKTYCVDCHNAKKTKGKTRLDKDGFSFSIKTLEDADNWQKVLDAINAKEMPPEDEVQPKGIVKMKFLEMLSEKMVEVREYFKDTAGKTVMRRMNAREYLNTMKSILGVTVNIESLPNDKPSSGFDTDGGSLYMSSDQIDQYMAIARRGLERVLLQDRSINPKLEKREPEKINKDLVKAAKMYKDGRDRGLAYEQSKDLNKKPEDFGLVDARDALTRRRAYGKHYQSIVSYLENPNTKTGFLIGTGRRTHDITIPLNKDGIYKIKARVGLLKEAPADRAFLNIGTYSRKTNNFIRTDTFQVINNVERGQIIETSLEVDGATSISIREKIREKALKFVQTKRAAEGAIWVDWVETEGPFPYAQTPLIKKVSSVMKEDVTDEKVKRLLKEFTQKAFRGDHISPDYIDQLTKIYLEEKRLLKKPILAILSPLSVILSSPGFIYLPEKSSDEQQLKLSQRELAIRLSYFLWSGPPDLELEALAEAGKLHDTKILDQQIKRMLLDERAINFYRGFTKQWLELDRLELFQFDLSAYPRFDDTSKYFASEEIYQTIKTLVHENLSTSNLLKSDFVVINGLMAKQYGFNGIKGDHYRKVSLDKNSIRGGLVSTTAVLAMGSNGHETSPVERGAWVLRKILNRPPPPAPANVPQLAEIKGEKHPREILKIHQEEPQCASCHSKIDPVGFGLENFDPVGNWRDNYLFEHEEEYMKKGKKRVRIDESKNIESPIDVSGQIYQGPKFSNYAEYKDVLLKQKDDFNKGLIAHLLSYALGRPDGFSDRDLIEEIHSKVKKDHYKFQSMIRAIVHSEPFKIKK